MTTKKSKKFKKLIISCGGTGGHFYPGLSFALQFIEDGGEAMLLVSGKNSTKQSQIAAEKGISCVCLPKLASPHSFKTWITFGFGLLKGGCKSFFTLRKFKPDIIIGMGSFTSLPAMLMAKFMGISIFLHDGNARVGKANRFFSRWAKWIGTAFPAVNSEACRCQVYDVGMPLRKNLIDTAKTVSKAEAVATINKVYNKNFDIAGPILLLLGGSQGAVALNQIVSQTLPVLPFKVQIIHLAGKNKTAKISDFYQSHNIINLTLEFADDMSLFYKSADLVIARAGGGTVAELALFNKYAFLVPYPYAAENHQLDNALYLAENNAAELINQKDLSVDLLKNKLQNYFGQVQQYLPKKELAKPTATTDMLNLISLSFE